MICPACEETCREIWREGPLRAERCPACGYIGSHGAAPVAYEEDYFTRWYLERRGERLAYFERLFAQLSESGSLRPGEPLLDLGAGVGHWLEVCAGHGLRALTAVEPSVFGRLTLEGLAQGPLPGLGIRAALTETEGPFDTISVLDVLSHVDDLPGTLGALAARLRTGGRLVVKAPNHPPALFRAARCLSPLGRGRALVSARSQRHHFDRESLPALLGRFGFETLASGTTRELDVPLGLAPGAWALQRLTRAMLGEDSLLWIGTPRGGRPGHRRVEDEPPDTASIE